MAWKYAKREPVTEKAKKHREYYREYYKKNKEKINKDGRLWRENNYEYVRQYQQAYYLLNRERIRKRKKDLYEARRFAEFADLERRPDSKPT